MIPVMTRNLIQNVPWIPKWPRMPMARRTGKYVLTPIQPIVIRNCIHDER